MVGYSIPSTQATRSTTNSWPQWRPPGTHRSARSSPNRPRSTTGGVRVDGEIATNADCEGILTPTGNWGWRWKPGVSGPEFVAPYQGASASTAIRVQNGPNTPSRVSRQSLGIASRPR